MKLQLIKTILRENAEPFHSEIKKKMTIEGSIYLVFFNKSDFTAYLHVYLLKCLYTFTLPC